MWKLSRSLPLQYHSAAVAVCWTLYVCCASLGYGQAQEPGFREQWKINGLVGTKFEITGTGSRSNPLRRQLRAPFMGRELYFRFRMRYAASSIDTPEDGDGEFFVFWLDDREGANGSTHSGGVPNVGVHVAGGANRFMARYAPDSQKFAEKLVGDRDFLVVGCLRKTDQKVSAPFGRLDVWVDPQRMDRDRPHATTTCATAINRVAWVGFSTGGKTELDDRITVWDIDVARSWNGILGLPTSHNSPEPAQVATVAFGKHVLPILRKRCFGCHAGDDAEHGVRLDVLDEVLNRTTPRNAQASRLYQLVSMGKMPPDGPRLSAGELKVLGAWINEGLVWDEEKLPTPVPQTDHWAFQPIRRPVVPKVKNSSWVRTPVDAFVARRHEQLGVVPAKEADPDTLDRRVTLDLLGLPPSSIEISQPASQIGQLLAHPAYGERWGRHWLDVARWAESNGHQHNRDRKHAWRYRDWVVNSFNSNMSYADFVRAQIAGDEIRPTQDENLIATGFLAAAQYSGNELDKDIQRNDILVDVVNATSSAFLGLTVECAQCHTHKFDPISIRDYYRLQAFFARGQPANLILSSGTPRVRAAIDERWKIYDTARDRLIDVKRRQGIANPIVIPKNVISAIKGSQKKRFQELNTQLSGLQQAWAWQSVTSANPNAVAPHDMRFPLPRDPSVLAAVESFLLIRGDVKSPGPVVAPGWPAVLGPSPRDSRISRTGLAEWLTSPENPLTARVWVNRVWQWHFGRGLVETSSDLGTQGTAPTHPELLDYLACELIDSGWNTHHIHKLIVNSATYRLSSDDSANNARLDPENHTIWRWSPRRLEAEAIRDCILAVSEQVDLTRGGPSVPQDSTRRSLYLRQKRNNLPGQQQLFDSANGNVSCSRRRVSTTALQPLWLLNSSVMQRAAREFAKRSGTIETAFKLALNREPASQELKALRHLESKYGLVSACLTLLNSSEFLYLK